MNKETKAAVAAYDAARTQVNRRLVERRTEIDLIFACLIAQVHPLLIGGAGVAKSMLIDELMSHIGSKDEEVRKFTRLLAKATPPEEVLGPPNLAALQEGRWERVVDGKLPTAHVAFLDEIFKSNSTVLNSLLKIINERVFENDGQVIQCPLWMLVGASNELPGHERDDLRAFRDRFGICKIVEPVQTTPGRLEVLGGQLDRLAGNGYQEEFEHVTMAQIHLLQRAVGLVSVPDAVRSDVVALQKAAEEENLNVSSRRLFEGVRVGMAMTVMRGDDTMRPSDLMVMQHVLWTDPEDAPTAYNLATEHAGRAAKLAGQVNNEYVELSTTLHELQARVSAAKGGPLDGETVSALSSLNIKFKMFASRVAEVERKIKGEADTSTVAELSEIASAVHAARAYIRDTTLGFGNDMPSEEEKTDA